MTDLTNKAIDIKGNKYVLVSDRILAFNSDHKNGSIATQLINEPNAGLVVFKAKVTPDAAKPERFFTGYSQAKWGDGMVNKTAAMENAETSAVGRALAMMGIGVIDSVASADEMSKAGATTPVNVPALGKCKNCGAQNKLSRNGRPYCGALCWKKDDVKIEKPKVTQVEEEEIPLDDIPF